MPNNYLENQIDKLIDYLDKKGYHAHKNHCNRTIDGTYIRGEPYDYDLFLPNYKACFDTKMCEADKYHIKDKDLKQINNLKKCKNAGIDSFFLIYFAKTKKLLYYDVDVLIEVLKISKSISPELGKEWDLQKWIGKIS